MDGVRIAEVRQAEVQCVEVQCVKELTHSRGQPQQAIFAVRAFRSA